MLRSLLAAVAAGQAAAKAKQLARQTAYGTIAIVALIIALVFGSLSIYFALTPTLGPSLAAASVTGGFVLFAVIILLWAMRKRKEPVSHNMLADLGLPASVANLNSQDLEAVVDQARLQVRKIGPVKLSLAAFGAGLLLAQLNRIL